MVYNFVSEAQLCSMAYTSIVVTSFCFILRAALRTWRRKFRVAEDSTLGLGYLLFLAMTALYITAASKMYSEDHDIPAGIPWSRVDSIWMRQIFFANNLIFLCCLWATKYAILFISRGSLGPGPQMQWWWCLVTFCGLTFIGGIISNFLSCRNWHGLWKIDGCSASGDERSQQAFLYYCIIADVMTDLFLMLLAFNLLRRQQRILLHRVAIIFISPITLLCIISAILRAIGSHNTVLSTHLPTTSWLALWSIVEAATAVIIGCSPGLYLSITEIRAASKSSTTRTAQNFYPFDNRRYQRQSISESVVPMQDIASISRGHSRVTSINGHVVGVSELRQVPMTPTSRDGSHVHVRKHTPTQLPSSYGHSHSHMRSKSGGASFSNEFWKDVDNASITGSGPKKETFAPMIITPVVSKRSSKASLKYTPIQIPGTVGHKKDAEGFLSGAFWGEMEEGERKGLEERAKEIRIRFGGQRVVRMSEDGGGRGRGGGR